MPDFEPPSFSLDLDFDLDSPPPPPSSTFSFSHSAAADDFNIRSTNRALKRLRRGPGPKMRCEVGDDEIEVISSQEDPCTGANMPPSSHPYSGGSIPKFSLHGHRVLTTQSTGKCKMARKEQVTDTPVFTSTEANNNGFTFPKLTVSPLRKFMLLDSDTESDTDTDSDDPCANEYANREVNKVNSSSKAKLRNPVENPNMSGQKRANVSEGVSRGQDLWDDFYTEKRFAIPNPALDEVCEEYFQSVKNNRTDPPSKSVGNCSREIKGCVQTHIVIDDDDRVHCKLGNHVPPAHHYFHHDDPRVQNLVRSRLLNFCPLGATHGRNQHTIPSAINYMSQFDHGPSSKREATQKTNPDTSSKRVKQNSRKSNIEEVPERSGSWVYPRCSIIIPTDAGKRWVQAVVDQSVGHWFTSQEGKRANPDSHKFRFKGVDHADKLTDLFLEGVATGKFALAPSQGSLPTDSAKPCEVGGNNSKQKVIDLDSNSQVQIDEPGIVDLNDDTTDFGNNKRRRGKRNVDLIRPIPKPKQEVTIKDCVKLLDQLEEVAKGSKLYLFACELFLIKEQRELFEALDASIRLIWLENKKNKPPNN